MRTYQAVGRNKAGTDMEVQGTITMDDAGVITYSATPGNKRWMRELMNESIPVRIKEIKGPYEPMYHVPKPGKKMAKPSVGVVTRKDNPATWFEWLPAQYHGSAFYVVEIDAPERRNRQAKRIGKARRNSSINSPSDRNLV
jgi:hypothetical protein